MASTESGAMGAETKQSPSKEKTISLNIVIGWTFSQGNPSGTYKLEGITCSKPQGNFTNGKIYIEGLEKTTGSGTLKIILKDGPSYKADVEFDLPNIQTPAGLVRRLTNLGFYAGTDGTFDGRMQWAVRAFKRVYMNGFKRNRTEMENNDITQTFLSAIQRVYGAHTGDAIPGDGLSFSEVNRKSGYCGMFGSRTYRRGSFEKQGAPDDNDPQPGQAGVWEGNSAATVKDEPIAGNFKIYLRAFDPSKNEGVIRNRVNLPQPIHMAQFVLFELGYWLVCGEKDNWIPNNTLTQDSFKPDGWFGRYTQWAVREFQCYAKFDYAAKEDIASNEAEYLSRLRRGTPDHPPRLTGDARYPDNGKIDNTLNEETRKALQAWADEALRYPVMVIMSKIMDKAIGLTI
jgi:peptidoglycan hydrolase-like protein with peptidoglycan-binding domain